MNGSELLYLMLPKGCSHPFLLNIAADELIEVMWINGQYVFPGQLTMIK